jgi:hypothetical protein
LECFFLLCRKPISRDIIAPLRASPAPIGGGGACDASVLPVQKFSVFLCTGNTTLSQPGRPSGGARPLERQMMLDDFYGAFFFRFDIVHWLQMQQNFLYDGFIAKIFAGTGIPIGKSQKL